MKTDPILRAGYNAVSGNREKKALPWVLVRFRTSKLPRVLLTLASRFLLLVARGFDIAVATRVGQSKVVPPKGKPNQQVGYIIAAGTQDANPKTPEDRHSQRGQEPAGSSRY